MADESTLHQQKMAVQDAAYGLAGDLIGRARQALAEGHLGQIRSFVEMANLACTVHLVQTPAVTIGGLPTVNTKTK